MKRLYVFFVRLLRGFFRLTGILGWLDKKMVHNRIWLWLRSLFAIYDLDDMVHIDLPWWQFDAIDQVDIWLKKKPDAVVFEYGSGASSFWLAKRAAKVFSVEHDADWYQLMQKKGLPDQLDLTLVPPEKNANPIITSTKKNWQKYDFHQYVDHINQLNTDFDLIIIDGRARPDCLKAALSKIKKEGLIIFDNAGRKRYQKTIRESDLQVKKFHGLTACLPYADCTAILKRADHD